MLADPNDLPALLDEIACERIDAAGRTREMFRDPGFDMTPCETMERQAHALRRAAQNIREQRRTAAQEPKRYDLSMEGGITHTDVKILRGIEMLQVKEFAEVPYWVMSAPTTYLDSLAGRLERLLASPLTMNEINDYALAYHEYVESGRTDVDVVARQEKWHAEYNKLQSRLAGLGGETT